MFSFFQLETIIIVITNYKCIKKEIENLTNYVCRKPELIWAKQEDDYKAFGLKKANFTVLHIDKD